MTDTQLQRRGCIIKLAKQIAKQRGLRGGKGGWLYRPNGKPHCQGYFQYAMRLVRNGDIGGVEFDGKGNRVGFIVLGTDQGGDCRCQRLT